VGPGFLNNQEDQVHADLAEMADQMSQETAPEAAIEAKVNGPLAQILPAVAWLFLA